MSQFEEKAREFKEIAREIGQEYGSACLEAEVSLALGEAFEAGRNSMCQADSTAACEPVSPSALHPGNGGEAEATKLILGALNSAKAAHPGIDYANFSTSIAKRIYGALFKGAASTQENADLPQGEAHFSDPKPLG